MKMTLDAATDLTAMIIAMIGILLLILFSEYLSGFLLLTISLASFARWPGREIAKLMVRRLIRALKSFRVLNIEIDD